MTSWLPETQHVRVEQFPNVGLPGKWSRTYTCVYRASSIKAGGGPDEKCQTLVRVRSGGIHAVIADRRADRGRPDRQTGAGATDRLRGRSRLVQGVLRRVPWAECEGRR